MENLYKQNTELGVTEIMSKTVNWIRMAQYRDQWWDSVNMVMNLQVPSNLRNFPNSWDTITFSRIFRLNGVSYIQKSSLDWL